MTNDIEMVTRHCNPTMKLMHVMPQLFVLSATKLKVWSKLLPVPAAHHERAKRSWLISKSNGKIGCIACKNFPANDAVREDGFATCQIDSGSVQLCRLRKHAASSWHCRAAMMYLKIQPGMVPSVHCGAPPVDHFQTVIASLKQGTSPAAGIKDIGSARKIINMVYCIAEGMRQIERDFLKYAVSVSMRRDESKARLVIRYSATSTHLTCKSGILGVARGCGTGANNITLATTSILNNFATPRFNPKPDIALVDHLRKITHQVIVDSAADEILSARQMKEGVGIDSLTPQLKMITLDKGHTCGILLNRPFHAGPMLEELLQCYLHGEHSIIATIDHSPHIREVWAYLLKHDEHTEIGSRTKTIGFAKAQVLFNP